jgi:transposase-like protein
VLAWGQHKGEEMTHYSKDFKSSIVARLLPPNNAKVIDLAKETGVPKDTLYGWLKRSRNKQGVAPYSCKPSDRYSADDKLAMIIETASLNETELGEFCRRKGIYPVQIANWKDSMVQGLTSVPSKASREQNQEQVRTIQQLEKDLARKDKALAEVVALLVLQKKFQALMEAPEAEKSSSRCDRK